MKISRILAGLPILAVSAAAWADGPQALDQVQMDTVTAGAVSVANATEVRGLIDPVTAADMAEFQARQQKLLEMIAQLLVTELPADRLAELIEARQEGVPGDTGADLPEDLPTPVLGGNGTIARALQNPQLAGPSRNVPRFN